LENGIQGEITNSSVVESVYSPDLIEGLDYTRYTGSSVSFTVLHEITFGDILVSTLLAFLILFMIIRFFHSLIIGGGKQ
jgi:hypothetical protein